MIYDYKTKKKWSSNRNLWNCFSFYIRFGNLSDYWKNKNNFTLSLQLSSIIIYLNIIINFFIQSIMYIIKIVIIINIIEILRIFKINRGYMKQFFVSNFFYNIIFYGKLCIDILLMKNLKISTLVYIGESLFIIRVFCLEAKFDNWKQNSQNFLLIINRNSKIRFYYIFF